MVGTLDDEFLLQMYVIDVSWWRSGGGRRNDDDVQPIPSSSSFVGEQTHE